MPFRGQIGPQVRSRLGARALSIRFGIEVLGFGDAVKVEEF